MDYIRSYFVRHTDGMSIGDTAIDDLCQKDKIAIHYPEQKSHAEDLTSLEPEDYQEGGALPSIFSSLRTSYGEFVLNDACLL